VRSSLRLVTASALVQEFRGGVWLCNTDLCSTDLRWLHSCQITNRESPMQSATPSFTVAQMMPWSAFTMRLKPG